MKQIRVLQWCDYPGCAKANERMPGGQETRNIEFWVYTPGKGRKSKPILVEVCLDHEHEMKALYSSLFKADQRNAKAMAE